MNPEYYNFDPLKLDDKLSVFESMDISSYDIICCIIISILFVMLGLIVMYIYEKITGRKIIC